MSREGLYTGFIRAGKQVSTQVIVNEMGVASKQGWAGVESVENYLRGNFWTIEKTWRALKGSLMDKTF